jgi:uncharacterized protein YndB with AHSA1/START domain/GNAT superfamily N-acetyltransferase
MTVFHTTRDIAATPESVFAALSNPRRLARWWGPAGFTNSFEICEFRPGGRWVFTMHGPDGASYHNESEFLEIVPGSNLRIRHVSPPHFELVIRLTAVERGTTVSWTQTFDDPALAERVRSIVEPSNEQNLDRLEAEVSGFRCAHSTDAAECVALRGRTRENAASATRLAELNVTVESWGQDIASGRLIGHVCMDDGSMVGYCFGDSRTGEVVVLAVLPSHEGRGAGKALLSKVMRDLAAMGHRRLFLGCSANPVHRSYGFYRHLGWRSTGEVDERNDEILEILMDEVPVEHGR